MKLPVASYRESQVDIILHDNQMKNKITPRQRNNRFSPASNPPIDCRATNSRYVLLEMTASMSRKVPSPPACRLRFPSLQIEQPVHRPAPPLAGYAFLRAIQTNCSPLFPTQISTKPAFPIALVIPDVLWNDSYLLFTKKGNCFPEKSNVRPLRIT